MDLKQVKYNHETKNILINEPTKTFYISTSEIQPANDFYVCLYIADVLIGFTNNISEIISWNDKTFYKIKLFENDVILPFNLLHIYGNLINLIGAKYNEKLTKFCDFNEVYYLPENSINDNNIDIFIKYIDCGLADKIRLKNKTEYILQKIGINDNIIRIQNGMCGMWYTWTDFDKCQLSNII